MLVSKNDELWVYWNLQKCCTRCHTNLQWVEPCRYRAINLCKTHCRLHFLFEIWPSDIMGQRSFSFFLMFMLWLYIRFAWHWKPLSLTNNAPVLEKRWSCAKCWYIGISGNIWQKEIPLSPAVRVCPTGPPIPPPPPPPAMKSNQVCGLAGLNWSNPSYFTMRVGSNREGCKQRHRAALQLQAHSHMYHICLWKCKVLHLWPLQTKRLYPATAFVVLFCP